MNSTSPANSSVSTTAIFPGGGGGSGGNPTLDDFPFPSDLVSIQDLKDDAMRAFVVPQGLITSCIPVLKADLMAALNKGVKILG